MESWRTVWREGFAPTLTDDELNALRDALAANDPRLTQGSTTTPPPLMCVQNWKCEAACLVGYAGWQGQQLETVGEVEEFFAEKCFRADQLLGEPAACRSLLNFFDDGPRDEVFKAILEEVEAELRKRATRPATDMALVDEPQESLAV
jgi:hypothetical protein